MSAATILLGTVLTFATTDGTELQLVVTLTKPATAALEWGHLVLTSTPAKDRHVFRALPVPPATGLTYKLSVGTEAPRLITADAIGTPGKLRIAVYGDSREGSEPHRLLLDQMAKRDIDVLVHTGDVVRRANDDEGWAKHLALSLPISSRVPLILGLGNHEIAQSGRGGPFVDGLTKAMRQIPPPDDELAKTTGAPLAAFHVRVGPALFISLDSNAPIGLDTPQLKFLERALEEKGDAKFVFVCYHHGPLSSGPHGGHEAGSGVMRLLEKYGATASLAGHDHTYERIIYNGVTYLISGGGGAPLYARRQLVPGSKAFASSYNWVEIVLDGDRAELEAYSLEGALLDRATIAPLTETGGSGAGAGHSKSYLVFALLVLLFAFIWAGKSLTRTT